MQPVPEAPLLGRLERDPQMVARHSDPGEPWYFLSPIKGMGDTSGVVSVHPAMSDTIGRLLSEHWVRVVSRTDHTAIPMLPTVTGEYRAPGEPPATSLPASPTGHPQQMDQAIVVQELRQALVQTQAQVAQLTQALNTMLAERANAAAPAESPEGVKAVEQRNEQGKQWVAKKTT